MRYVYDPETQGITDTGVVLDLLRDYATVPFHENGKRLANLLNEDESRQRFRHVKTGGLYTIISRAAALEAIPSETYVVYRGADGLDWIRPQHEFFDGRFELA